MKALPLPLSVEWKDSQLLLLNQTLLPHEVVIEPQHSVEQVWDSIRQLKVRGAPAIGLAAAYGMLVAIDVNSPGNVTELVAELSRRAEFLRSARPTAVNLGWALDRMLVKMNSCLDQSAAELFASMLEEAQQIHRQDREICQAIGREGLALIREGMNILTHCNAGALAVSELGTALAPLYLAHQEGIRFHVYADETRPLLQGARLTAWELQKAGIDVTLICDNMAAFIMSQGKVDMILVGTDRVAANGDVANKIGTLGLAVLAHYFNIPFYVACPSSTIDLATANGSLIEIEMRDASEVRELAGIAVAAGNVKVANPAFDVTPAALVTGILTEKGLLAPPFPDRLAELF